MNPIKKFAISAAVMVGGAVINHAADLLPPEFKFLAPSIVAIAGMLVKNPWQQPDTKEVPLTEKKEK